MHLIRLLSLTCFIGMTSPLVFEVPSVPNESLVIGEILELTPMESSEVNIEPPQLLFRLKLRILFVHDVERQPNFLKKQEGKILEVYSREILSIELVGKVVKVRVSFRGDERGGRYWMLEVPEVRTF